MKLSEQIEEAKRHLEYLQSLQDNCDHEWGKGVYDPLKEAETKWVEDYHIMTETFYKEVPTGVIKTTDRWCRTCKKCGKKDYTFESEITRVMRKPIFRNK